ncbi:thiopurine S-methyltransferase [Oceanisphaera arctica]|uniref:Thiopurine S-methyltransferase n=1 Tax=Oceanisphaera arctica TaxID=641510 RepID=A0A2P5TI72_9GAMM|nr:thiopurine S-methyltransferase [Oceanisphaera arctica]PPL14287.1 thiopurine S-methyltransferase [Oceanisphaera arctica]GHA10180.1 thiopurine S-methyltransferase [Oceanisphaera arctica]
MEAEFWHQRWQSSRIGFHRQQVNAQLSRFWPRLTLPEQTEVLVPLCGKSRDMHWLAELGHPVAGFELSPLAVQDFFAEAGLEPESEQSGSYRCRHAGRIHLYEGDFFQADSLQRRFDAAYDRAALIALPEAMRTAYVDLLARLLNPGATLLLITVDYAPAQQQSPPFAVPESEVRRLFEAHFSIERLGHIEEGQSNPRVASGERRFFDELCFLLRRK